MRFFRAFLLDGLGIMSLLNKHYEAKAFIEATLTPAQFLALSDKEKENIKSTQVIPAKLGSNNFGMIKIVRKTPVYSVFE